MANTTWESFSVTQPQHTSADCFVCGVENESGLRARFFELENGELAARFTVLEIHNGYPGRAHGGVSGALLDEVIGRAIILLEPEVWGVTVEFTVRFHKPIPTVTPLTARGRVTENGGRRFTGAGELYLPDGVVAATATGIYIKLPLDRIVDTSDADRHSLLEAGWRRRSFPDDPREFRFPNPTSR